MLTVGRGQRIGIFGGSGVGKSTLIGMMTRNTAADITVVGLVGERGREVREFVEDSLGEEGRKRSVVLVSTSDQSPLLRMRAAMAATAVAEFYAAQGEACAAGAGFADSVCDGGSGDWIGGGGASCEQGIYAVVCLRAWRSWWSGRETFETGSITAFYTVLMEGDDQQDPVVDAVRSLLDGHVVLSRRWRRRDGIRRWMCWIR